MKIEKIVNELRFHAVRSGGAGGQHVNKVSSKVILKFDVLNSLSLDDEEKKRILNKLRNKLNKDKILILTSEVSRSQHKNKELVIKKFLDVIVNSLKVQKKRKPTKPSKNSIKKRRENKSHQSKKKSNRKKPNIDL